VTALAFLRKVIELRYNDICGPDDRRWIRPSGSDTVSVSVRSDTDSTYDVDPIVPRRSAEGGLAGRRGLVDRDFSLEREPRPFPDLERPGVVRRLGRYDAALECVGVVGDNNRPRGGRRRRRRGRRRYDGCRGRIDPHQRARRRTPAGGGLVSVLGFRAVDLLLLLLLLLLTGSDTTVAAFPRRPVAKPGEKTRSPSLPVGLPHYCCLGTRIAE